MKNALIIGASSGIGKALIPYLLKDYDTVGICARRTLQLDTIYREYPDRVKYATIDCLAPDVNDRLKRFAQEIGQLDLIINCVGNGEINKSLNLKIEMDSVDLNVKAFTKVINWAYHYFYQTRPAGQIVNISSLAGLRGNRSSPSYFASKAYQINYLQSLQHKSAKEKVNINCLDVRPGFVNTGQAKGEGLFWVVPINKAVKQIYTAIKKQKKVTYISKRWRLVAYLIRILPNWIYFKL